MALFLDLTVVLIVALTMYFVIKKGFVRSLLELLSVICSLILAKMFAAPVSQIFYKFLQGVISPKVEELINNLLKTDSLPETLHNDALGRLLSEYGVMFIDRENTTSFLSDSFTAMISYCLAYLLIFVGVMLLFKFATPVVCAVFKLPILRTANKLLSLVLGIALSVLYLLLFVSLMQILIPLLSSVYPESINSAVIEKTYIFSFIYNLDWIKILLS